MYEIAFYYVMAAVVFLSAYHRLITWQLSESSINLQDGIMAGFISLLVGVFWPLTLFVGFVVVVQYADERYSPRIETWMRNTVIMKKESKETEDKG